MDVSDASYYIQEKYKNKGSRMGHTKKKNPVHFQGILGSAII
jgi:hypothetical protein